MIWTKSFSIISISMKKIDFVNQAKNNTTSLFWWTEPSAQESINPSVLRKHLFTQLLCV